MWGLPFAIDYIDLNVPQQEDGYLQQAQAAGGLEA